MNLWAKRGGQLFLWAVLFFLLSCEDDSFLLGFKGNPKFKGAYHEIVFDGEKSSVLLLDSVFTDQYEISAPPINPVAYRYLIGQYTDPDFGIVRAEVFAGFLPNPAFPTKLTDPQGLDSITVQLLFDYYAYGPEITIDEKVLVYELTDTLSFFKRYMNTSTVPNKGTLLGELSLKKLTKNKLQPINLTQLRYEEQLDRNSANRDTLVLWGKLNLDTNEEDDLLMGFGNELFQYLKTNGDSALLGKYIPKFQKNFPGFAFISTQSGRLIGFNPTNALSRLNIHYHSTATNPLTTSLYFTPFPYVSANGFNNITTQRTGGLSGIGSIPNKQYFPYNNPSSNERYIQDGSTVITELDLSDYYSFIDTLENIVINSAELSIDVVAPPAGMNPPPSLYALLMKKPSDDKIVPLNMDIEEDSLKMVQYASNVFTELTSFAISTELSNQSPLILSYDGSTKRYSGYATMFFQKLFNNKDKPEYNIEHIGFFPATAPILKLIPGRANAVPVLKSGMGNTVNRAVLKASGIKLKLYYTKPNVSNLE